MLNTCLKLPTKEYMIQQLLAGAGKMRRHQFFASEAEMAGINIKSKVVDMTKGSPFRLLFIFMLPMLCGNVFQQLYNLADSAIVGKVLGSDALAAVGATGSLNFLFFSLCGGSSNGIGIVIAQYFGAGQDEKVKKTIGNAIYVMGTTAIIMGALGFALSRPVLTLLDTPAEVIDDSVTYMKIMSCGVIAVALYNCVAAMLRAVGDSKTPLYFLVVSCILNVGLDFLFVAGFGWGVAGAAVATVISQAAAGLAALLYAVITNPYFKIKREQMRVDLDIIRRILKLAIPLALQSSMIAVSCVILQRVVNSFGPTTMAAFTATSRFEQLVQQPFNSLGMAVSTFTGQNIGAKQLDRVKKGWRIAMLMMGTFAIAMIPVSFFAGSLIMKMFVDEVPVIELGTSALRITSLFYLFLGAIYVCRGMLNGAGDATFSLINGVSEVIGRVSFAQPLSYIPAIGTMCAWYGTGLTWCLAGIISIIRVLRGRWKTKGLIEKV